MAPLVGEELKNNRIKEEWWRDAELNCGHMDFQSTALPTELSRHLEKYGPNGQIQLTSGGADGIRSFVSLCSLQRRRLPQLRLS